MTSSLQLGIEREDKKCTFVLNVQQAAIHTTVLLRMWGREDKHLLFLLTSLRTTNCISPVTSLSRSKVPKAIDLMRKVPTDLFPCIQNSLQIRSSIIFPPIHRVLHHVTSVTTATAARLLRLLIKASSLHGLLQLVAKVRVCQSPLLRSAHPLKMSLSQSGAGMTEPVALYVDT